MASQELVPPLTRVQYVGDGSQSLFSLPFQFINDSDVELYLDDTSCTMGFQVQNGGPAAGASVVFAEPPKLGVLITIVRKTSPDSKTNFQESGPLRAKTLNAAFDQLAAVDQDAQRELLRTVRLHPTDEDANLTLPKKDDRAGKNLAFDSEGNLAAVRANDLPNEALPSLDDISPGEENVHFTRSHQQKLSTVEDGAQPNPDRVTETEKSSAAETEPRAFSPKDIADIASSYGAAIDASGLEPAISKRTAFNRDFGAENGTVCEGNDPRLSDARPSLPHAHASAEISGLANVATTGAYDDLIGRPNVPTSSDNLLNNSTVSGNTVTDALEAVAAPRVGDTHAAISSGNPHNTTAADVGAEPAIAKKSAFNRDFGSEDGTICSGNDPRLSDARPSLPHAHGSAEISGLANVATTGSYNDLSDLPTIPNTPLDLSVLGQLDSQATNDAPAWVLTESGTANDRCLGKTSPDQLVKQGITAVSSDDLVNRSSVPGETITEALQAAAGTTTGSGIQIGDTHVSFTDHYNVADLNSAGSTSSTLNSFLATHAGKIVHIAGTPILVIGSDGFRIPPNTRLQGAQSLRKGQMPLFRGNAHRGNSLASSIVKLGAANDQDAMETGAQIAGFSFDIADETVGGRVIQVLKADRFLIENIHIINYRGAAQPAGAQAINACLSQFGHIRDCIIERPRAAIVDGPHGDTCLRFGASNNCLVERLDVRCRDNPFSTTGTPSGNPGGQTSQHNLHFRDIVARLERDSSVWLGGIAATHPDYNGDQYDIGVDGVDVYYDALTIQPVFQVFSYSSVGREVRGHYIRNVRTHYNPAEPLKCAESMINVSSGTNAVVECFVENCRMGGVNVPGGEAAVKVANSKSYAFFRNCEFLAPGRGVETVNLSGGTARFHNCIFHASPLNNQPASGWIDFTHNPSNGQTIALGGTNVTFVTGTAGENEVQIQASLDATIDELVSRLNGFGAPFDSATYSADLDKRQLLIEYKIVGIGGNSFTVDAGTAGGKRSSSSLNGAGDNPVIEGNSTIKDARFVDCEIRGVLPGADGIKITGAGANDGASPITLQRVSIWSANSAQPLGDAIKFTSGPRTGTRGHHITECETDGVEFINGYSGAGTGNVGAADVSRVRDNCRVGMGYEPEV
jgi:hypothetical protein